MYSSIKAKVSELAARWQYWRRRAAIRHKARSRSKTIRHELRRLGFWHKTQGGRKRRSRIVTVTWESPLLLTENELWLPVNLRDFPARKTTDDLRDEGVLHSIEDRIGGRVRIDKLPNGRLCVVARMSDREFPKSISINTFDTPPDGYVLPMPLGLDIDGNQHWADLKDLKHYLIVGGTGGGKTNHMHGLIYSWISRIPATELELWLIDLKGQEFGKYDRLKSKDGIVRHFADRPDLALDVLSSAVKEINRRNQLMKQHDASDIEELAHLAGQRLRRIVVCMDEIAVLTLDPSRIGKQTVGGYAQMLITQIAALGRASGVHAVMATQHINTKVLTPLILANFETRTCFSTADWRKSQVVIETSEAVGLPPGRMFFRHEGRTTELQSPLINSQQVRLEVARIAQHGPDGGLGNEELLRHVRNAKLIVEVACQEFEGTVPRDRLRTHASIRDAMSASEFEQTCRRLERDGILTQSAPRSPRRVTAAFYKKEFLIDAYYLSADQSAERLRKPAEAPEKNSPPVIIDLPQGYWEASNGDQGENLRRHSAG